MNLNLCRLQLLPVGIAFALSGCSTLRNDYVEPVGENLARLSVVNRSYLDMRLDLYDDAQSCSGRRMVIQRDSPFVPPTKTPSVKIRANAPVSVTLLSGAAVSAFVGEMCAPTLTFTPDANVEYFIEMIVVGRKCLVEIRSATAGVLPASSVKARTWRTGTSEGSSFCKPD